MVTTYSLHLRMVFGGQARAIMIATEESMIWANEGGWDSYHCKGQNIRGVSSSRFLSTERIHLKSDCKGQRPLQKANG